MSHSVRREFIDRELEVSEPGFIDQVLIGWAAWARNDGIDLRPTCAGDLWQIQAIIEARDYVLVLTDDSFLLVDQRVAILPGRLRAIIFVEYMDDGSKALKLRSTGLSRTAYRERLQAAQWSLYSALLPALDNWRQKSVKNAHSSRLDPQKHIFVGA